MHGNRRMAEWCVGDPIVDEWQEKQGKHTISWSRVRRLEEMTRASERRCASPTIPQEPKQIATCEGEKSPLESSLKRNVEIPVTTPQTQSSRNELAFIRETFQPMKSEVRGSITIGGKHTKKHQVEGLCSTQTVLSWGCL